MSEKVGYRCDSSPRKVRLTRHGKKREEGSVLLIVVGIVIPIFMAFAVLAIDFSRLALIRGELQSSADAAALVGAEALLISGKSIANAQKDANDYVLKNEAGGTNPNFVVSARAGCVNPATPTIWTTMPSTKLCAAPALPGMRLTIRNQTNRLGFSQVFYIEDKALNASAAAVIVTSGTQRIARLLY